MKRKIYFFILFPIYVLAACFGCASYKAKPLPNLAPEFAAYSETIDDVTFACETLTKEQCKKHFDRDIIKKGYQPLLIAIANDSDKHIVFSPKGVSLPVSPPEEVAEKVHTSTAGRATAYGVGALFLWPLAIPMIVDGAKSYEANTQLDKDFSEKNIGELVINPHTTHNGVIFISNENFEESFSVRLVNRDTGKDLNYNIQGMQGHFSANDIPSKDPKKTESEEP